MGHEGRSYIDAAPLVALRIRFVSDRRQGFEWSGLPYLSEFFRISRAKPISYTAYREKLCPFAVCRTIVLSRFCFDVNRD